MVEANRRPLRKMPEPPAVFAGVCSGMAYGFGFSTLLVRLGTIALFIAFPAFVLIMYVIAALSMDKWDAVPDDYNDVTG